MGGPVLKVSNPSRASYRFLRTDHTARCPSHERFQTLPGLLTGFFFLMLRLRSIIVSSFKPFQGFLPVSSCVIRRTRQVCMCVSNPSRASYRFLRPYLCAGWFWTRMFQTLPGLLTGFFSRKTTDTAWVCNVSNPSRASYRFLPPLSLRETRQTTKFQTLPGLLTGFFTEP